MEIIDHSIKGSKITMKYLNYFSCSNCREIGSLPCFLKCNHIYCENCVSKYTKKQTDGSLICYLCGDITSKEDLLPEMEMRLLLIDLKSSDDEQFYNKYKNKLDFNFGECNIRNIVLFLLKFFSIENKSINTNVTNNYNKKCKKRTYIELKNENNLFKNNNDFKELKSKALFKGY